MKFRSLRRKQSGLSIVEVMVALAIGSLLMIGVVSLFLGSRQSYHSNDAQSRLQENARFALEALGHDMRMGRYMGCLPYGDAAFQYSFFQVANPVSPVKFRDAPPVFGFKYTTANTGGILDGVIDSSVVTLRRLSDIQIPIEAMASSESPVVIPAAQDTFKKNDYLVVFNCEYATLFRKTNASNDGSILHADEGGGVGNDKAGLEKAYGAGARVGQLIETTYYVAKTPRVNEQGTVINALFRLTKNGTGNETVEELAEGVEDMRIQYGIADGNGRLTGYIDVGTPYNQATNQVVSLRVELLVASNQNNITVEPQQYTFDSTLTTATDRRLRTVVSMTIALRNAKGLEQP